MGQYLFLPQYIFYKSMVISSEPDLVHLLPKIYRL